MSFLSMFRSKSKLKARTAASSSGPEAATNGSANTNVLELNLPSTSLLADDGTRRIGDQRSPSAQSVDSSLWDRVSEGGKLPGEESDTEESRKSVEEAETRKLGRAILGVGEITELLAECGGVVRERGSTTLGIFRPYRTAESPLEIRKLSLLFLAYAQDFQSKDVAPLPDIFGSKDTKNAKLARFRRELKYAVIHDVIGVLKWGLRHLCYSTSFSGTDTPTLDWYPTFLARSRSVSYPKDAFNKLLLPSLPEFSRTLLLEALHLVQAVAAQTEFNAMTPRKLCRMLGLYVFGLTSPDKEWTSWESLYEAWIEAGDAMEGCLKAYLRSQSTLPPRLAELIQSYPTLESRRDIKVVRVRLETQGDWKKAAKVNDQRTGLVAGTSKKGGEEGMRIERREPLVILDAAFGASARYQEDDDAEDVLWRSIVGQGNTGGIKGVLSEEFVRVLGLVGLDELPITPEPTSTSPPVTPDATLTRRRRSISSGSPHGLTTLSEEGSTTPTGGSISRFPNKSVGNLLPKSRTVTPSWSDFTLSGFVQPADFDEFGRITLPQDAQPAPRASTVGASRKFRTTKEGSSSSTDTVRSVPTSRIVDISTMKVEEEFIDVWLDTLVDPTACASWPSFLIASLHPSLLSTNSKIEHLFITDSLVPFLPTPTSMSKISTSQAAMNSVVSLTGSTMSAKWNRRMSGLFTSSLSGKSKGTGLGGESGRRISRRPRTSGVENEAPLPGLPSSVSTPTMPRISRESAARTLVIGKPTEFKKVSIIPTSTIVTPTLPAPPPTVIRTPSTNKIPRVKPPTSTLPYISTPDPVPSPHSDLDHDDEQDQDAERMGIPNSVTTQSMLEAPVIVAATMAVLGVATLVASPRSPGSPSMSAPTTPEDVLHDEAILPVQEQEEEPVVVEEEAIVEPIVVATVPVEEEVPVIQQTLVVAEEAPVEFAPVVIEEVAPIVEESSPIVEPSPEVTSVAEPTPHLEHVAADIEHPTPVDSISVAAPTSVVEPPTFVEPTTVVEPTAVVEATPPINTPTPPVVLDHAKDIVIAAAVVPLVAIAAATIHATPEPVVETVATPVLDIASPPTSAMKESALNDTVRETEQAHIPTPATPVAVPVTLPEPSTPLKTPSKIPLPPSAAPSPNTPTAAARVNPASPASISSTSSKKFLGSKTIGALLRRKKSSFGPADVEVEKEKEGKEGLKLKGMVERKAIKKDEAVRVSSVKKRVMEIEAGRREEEEALAALAAGGAAMGLGFAAISHGYGSKNAADVLVTATSVPLPLDSDDTDAESITPTSTTPPAPTDVAPASPTQLSFVSVSTVSDNLDEGDTTLTRVPEGGARRGASIVSVDTQASFATAAGSD